MEKIDHLMAEKITNKIKESKWGKLHQNIFKKIVARLGHQAHTLSSQELFERFE